MLEAKNHPHIVFPEGQMKKPTLIFPPLDPIPNIDTLSPKNYYIEKALTRIMDGCTIDTLNQVSGYNKEQIILGRVKEYVSNYAASFPLYPRLKYVAGCGVGFYNSLVAARAISFEDGLKLVQAEATDIEESSPNLIHTPDFDSHAKNLRQTLSEIRIKKARMFVVSPTSGKIIQDPEDIREEIIRQAVSPVDQEVINKAIREHHISKPMWRGLTGNVINNPRRIVTVAACMGGGLAILAYFVKKRRS